MQTTLQKTGGAPADVVWERYMNPLMWTSWAPQIRGVDASDNRLRDGTTGTVYGPLAVKANFEVLVVDEPARTWLWRAWVGPESLGLTLEHGVQDAVRGTGQRGTRTWLTVSGLAPLVLGYSPAAYLALGRLVA